MSKLSDFSGGTPDLDPEEAVKLSLSQWLDRAGATVFWEQSNPHGYHTFSTETTERPDLLIVSDGMTVAAEVKTPDGGGEVYDGAEQTVRYWRRYSFEGDEYRVAGSLFHPDCFVLVTGFSPDGRLFERHGARDQPRERHIKEALNYFDPPIHFLPDWEFCTTEAITRMMWRFATATNDARGQDADAGVGVLLSDRLDGSRPARRTPDDPGPFSQRNHPMALFKTFGDRSGGGGALCQNWRAIA